MITNVKGTHDLLDMTLYNFIVEQANVHFQKAYFTEIATPIIEPIDLFKRTLGTHTDVISKEMFIIQPHPNSDELICLRPEVTAPITRAFLQHAISQKPWKVRSHGPIFRYERPQKGRSRQFHQYNLEIINASSLMHDVQLISLLTSLFTTRMHLTDYSLSLNFLGCIEDRKRFRELLKTFLSTKADTICITCAGRANSNPMRVFDCKEASCQNVYLDAPFIADNICTICSQEWLLVQNQLTELSVPYTYNPKLVRGLDYYNKTVFEFSSTLLGSQNAFCGGGRYELAQQCGAQEVVPSIGAAFGIDRLMLLLEPLRQTLPLPKTSPLYCIVPLLLKQQPLALSYAHLLHRNNFSVEVLFEDASIKNIMKKVNKLGATYALLLGDDEQHMRTISIKNMITGSQVVVNQDQIINYLMQQQNKCGTDDTENAT